MEHHPKPQFDQVRDALRLKQDSMRRMVYTHVLIRGQLAVRSPLDWRGHPAHLPAFLAPCWVDLNSTCQGEIYQ
jgi:hypothetical protein